MKILQRRVRLNKPTLVQLENGDWVEESTLDTLEVEVVFDPDPTVDWDSDGADNS